VRLRPLRRRRRGRTRSRFAPGRGPCRLRPIVRLRRGRTCRRHGGLSGCRTVRWCRRRRTIWLRTIRCRLIWPWRRRRLCRRRPFRAGRRCFGLSGCRTARLRRRRAIRFRTIWFRTARRWLVRLRRRRGRWLRCRRAIRLSRSSGPFIRSRLSRAVCRLIRRRRRRLAGTRGGWLVRRLSHRRRCRLARRRLPYHRTRCSSRGRTQRFYFGLR
jgi:hypothetical protein